MMLTIFTPTYNRADYLIRVYDSLLAQNCYDFEWLIIDDGSTDHTADVVKSLQEDNLLDIRYYKKENGGKHTAYNLALEKASGDYFLCVDADDRLSPYALASIKTAFTSLNGYGIIAYKSDVNGTRLSDSFPEQCTVCRINELAFSYGCTGEFTLIFPTDIARQYRFPVFYGEKFLGESVVYDQIDQVCQMLLLPEDITVCEYLQDGYTGNYASLMKNNPCGFSLYFMQRIDLMPSFTQKLIHAGKYHCFRMMGGKQAPVYNGKYRIVSGIGVPLGLLFRLYYKLFRGF